MTTTTTKCTLFARRIQQNMPHTAVNSVKVQTDFIFIRFFFRAVPPSMRKQQTKIIKKNEICFFSTELGLVLLASSTNFWRQHLCVDSLWCVSSRLASNEQRTDVQNKQKGKKSLQKIAVNTDVRFNVNFRFFFSFRNITWEFNIHATCFTRIDRQNFPRKSIFLFTSIWFDFPSKVVHFFYVASSFGFGRSHAQHLCSFSLFLSLSVSPFHRSFVVRFTFFVDICFSSGRCRYDRMSKMQKRKREKRASVQISSSPSFSLSAVELRHALFSRFTRARGTRANILFNLSKMKLARACTSAHCYHCRVFRFYSFLLFLSFRSSFDFFFCSLFSCVAWFKSVQTFFFIDYLSLIVVKKIVQKFAILANWTRFRWTFFPQFSTILLPSSGTCSLISLIVSHF